MKKLNNFYLLGTALLLAVCIVGCGNKITKEDAEKEFQEIIIKYENADDSAFEKEIDKWEEKYKHLYKEGEDSPVDLLMFM